MKVLHVSSVCGFGGVETVIANLAKEQRKAGMDIAVFFFEDRGASVQFKGVCEVHLGDCVSLSDLLTRGHYDLLHVVADSAKAAHPHLRRAGYRGAVVVTSHGTFTGHLGSRYVNAVSEFGAKEIQALCPVNVEVVYNGIDTDQFSPPDKKTEGPPIIAWVGRSNEPLKDYGGVVALANSDMASGFKFMVVDGSSGDRRVSDWMPNNVETVRCTPWQKMPDFYRAVSASGGFLLSTAVCEWCPMNILEAQACGCPVIAPRVGGIPELVVHKETGFLYNRSDGIRGLEEAIDWLYSGDNYNSAAQAAVVRVRDHFTVEHMFHRYAQLYERVIAQHRSSLMTRTMARLKSAAVRMTGTFSG